MPNTQPPPSRRIQTELYSPVLNFFKNDMASFNGIWYRCTAEDVSKTKNNKTIITNACNNGTPTDNTTSWVKVGDANTVDLTPPIFATAWNENLNFKIGDYYADSSL